ncbi:MAG TPA: carbon storage regulator [Gammaproteobacteria bacterium]|nr:carbon storage regulator [Gammaproteobacteria bacterium]
MLVLTRKSGESILICLSEEVDPDMPVRDLFQKGPIRIQLLGNRLERSHRIGIDAPEEFAVLREEIAG